MAYPDDGDPLDLQILDYVRTKLLAIEPPSYFTTVAGAEVWETSRLFDSQDSPFVYIIPQGDSAAAFPVESKRRRQMLLSLLLQYRFIAGASDWKDAIYKFKADVSHAFNTDYQLNGLCEYVDVQDANLPDADLSSGVAEAVVNLSIRYRHANNNPSSIN